MNTPQIRLLLVDDHFMVRMGMRNSLEEAPDMTVVAEAGSAGQAVALYAEHRPDVMLMDGRLPDFHGIVAARKIRGEFPGSRIILISIDEREEDIHRAIEAGVQSYLPKSVGRDELLLAIRKVHAGGHYFPPEIAARVAQRRLREPLSAREVEVLNYVMKGFANKQIAEELRITEATVKAHVSRVMAKLEVPDRTRAVMVAIQYGILHSDDPTND